MTCKIVYVWSLMMDSWTIEDKDDCSLWFIDIISRTTCEIHGKYELHVRCHSRGIDAVVSIDHGVACSLFENVVVDQSKFLETVKEIANAQ